MTNPRIPFALASALYHVAPRKSIHPPEISASRFDASAQLEVDTRSAGLRERFAQAAAAERAEVAKVLRHVRAGHLVLSTDSNWLLDVARHVAAARRTRGVAR